MSGVYIAGMQKPEKCDDCPLQTADMICELSTCPLIPVPDHGRLIDAEALMKQVEHDAPLSTVYEKTMRRYLNNAPTIIPADKKDPEP